MKGNWESKIQWEKEKEGERKRERATAACGACESERDDQQWKTTRKQIGKK